MFKIYVQNKSLFLIDEMTKEAEDYLHLRGTVFINELTVANVNFLLKEMEKDDISAGIFQHNDAQELLEAFKIHLTLIQASGGLVYTPDLDVLLIFRKGKWDLPKGKLEEGEELESCAVREIQEETGLENAEIIKPLLVTYHTYYERGKHILKESHWFLMKSLQALPLIPQIEEDIEQCVWAPVAPLSAYIANMHASIIDVVNKGLKEIMVKD